MNDPELKKLFPHRETNRAMGDKQILAAIEEFLSDSGLYRVNEVLLDFTRGQDSFETFQKRLEFECPRVNWSPSPERGIIRDAILATLSGSHEEGTRLLHEANKIYLASMARNKASRKQRR